MSKNPLKRFKEAFRRTYQEFRGIVASLIGDGIERGEFQSDVNPESIAAALWEHGTPYSFKPGLKKTLIL